MDTGRDFRGGQELLLTLARGLRNRGHAQIIACLRDSALWSRARNLDLEVLTLPHQRPTRARAILEIRCRLKAEPHDIVHTHDAHAQTISALATIGLPVRRVTSRLVTFPPRHPAVHRLKYQWTCDAVIALSEPVRQTLLAAGIADRTIMVIEPGIEPPAAVRTREARQRAREKWGLRDDDFAVGHVAAFTSEKGQDVALEAAAILARTLPSAVLLLAGDGPMRTSPKVQRLLQLAGHAARMPGFVEDLEEFHAALDLYIMPSRSEAWGLSALHAMARGLPVVASNIGGLAAVVQDGASGWLVPAEDPVALARMIQHAASDRAWLAEAGRKARERSFQFSSERSVDRVEALYARLLAPERQDRSARCN